MVILSIKHADGSHYWKEIFPNKDLADKWLAVEQTRDYWKSDFIVEFEDKTSEETAKEQERQAEYTRRRGVAEARKAAIAAIKAKPGKTAADVKDLLELVVEYITGKDM